jgi:SynChlorMet cassette protein ScmD
MEVPHVQPESKVVANPVVVLREEFDDWAVLYNPDSAEAVGLNPTAVAVWKLLDGKRDVTQIVAGVTAGFSKVPEEAADEIRGLLEGFVNGGFAAVSHDA